MSSKKEKTSTHINLSRYLLLYLINIKEAYQG